MKPNCKNRTVFIGDNREVMLGLNAEIADAIITDPPFNSGQMRKDDKVKIDKKKSARRGFPVDEHGNAIQQYPDAWKIGDISDKEMEFIKYKDKDLVRFCQIIGNQHSAGMEAYLLMMATRLLLCHELLKETGSMFLHCDHSANNYLRMLMDAIFGKENFRNEIVWCYPPGGKAPKYGFHRKHDTILYYSKGKDPKFNHQFRPLTKEQIAKFTKTDQDGRKYKEYRGKTRTYLDDMQGSPVPSWWTDIPSLGQTISKERCEGWTTQKPLKLYTRLVKACTNPGDLVIDPFCGCATTLIAAENAGCRWIGMDIDKSRVALIEPQLAKLATQDLWKEDFQIIEIKSKKDLPKRKDNKPSKKKMEALKDQLALKQRKFKNYHYCEICGHPFPYDYLEIDHIHPKADGGGWELHNLQLLCSRCNRRKGSTKTNEQVRKELAAEGLLFHQRAAVHAYTGIPAEEYLKREESQEEENPKKPPRRKPKEDWKRKGASRQINIVL